MKEIIERIKTLKDSYPNRFEFFPSIDEKYTGPLTLYSPVDIDLIAYAEEKLSLELDPHIKELYSFSNGMVMAGYYTYGIRNKNLYEFTDVNLTIWEQIPHLEHRFIAFMGCIAGGPKYGYVADETGGRPKVAIMKNQMDCDYELTTDYDIVAHTIPEFFNLFLDKIVPKIEELKPKERFINIPEWED